MFGALSIEGDWTWWFAPVFNGHTFHVFLQMLVEHHAGRKVFLVVDNGLATGSTMLGSAG